MIKIHAAPSIILASQSPRRKDLLTDAGFKFSVVPSNVNEKSIFMGSPEVYVKTLAEIKAEEVAQRFPCSWVIGADTIVLIDHMILGKPASKNQARTMLKRLNGRTHQVYTGYCICHETKHRHYSHAVVTDVHFKRLTNEEIEWYVHTNEPYDKAGGYAIQGLGTFLVRSITGSYTSVVGLPVCEVIEFFIKEGVFPLFDRRHAGSYSKKS